MFGYWLGLPLSSSTIFPVLFHYSPVAWVSSIYVWLCQVWGPSLFFPLLSLAGGRFLCLLLCTVVFFTPPAVVEAHPAAERTSVHLRWVGSSPRKPINSTEYRRDFCSGARVLMLGISFYLWFLSFQLKYIFNDFSSKVSWWEIKYIWVICLIFRRQGLEVERHPALEPDWRQVAAQSDPFAAVWTPTAISSLSALLFIFRLLWCLH